MLELLAVVDKSTLLNDDAALRLMAQAVSRQIHRHLAPSWRRLPCAVVALPDGTPIPEEAIPIYLMDDADQANALGYHDVDDQGRPYGRVFVKTVLDGGGSLLDGPLSVSAVLSHEAMEWAIDPDCQLWADDLRGNAYALEVGDPVESDAYEIAVYGHNVAVSNYVTPAWFSAKAQGGQPFDLLGNVTEPFEMTKGGYVITMRDGQVSSTFGADVPAWRRASKEHPASRTARRIARFSGAPAAAGRSVPPEPPVATPGPGA